MTTNQDRAAEVIASAGAICGSDCTRTPADPITDCPRCAWCIGAYAQALADAGLLAPDLPTPDRDGRWWPTASRLGNVNIRGRRVYIHSGTLERMGISFTPDDADDLADILKAAAAAARTHQEKK